MKGLTRSSFSDYFEFIQLRLQHPEIRSHGTETWEEHFARLRREHKHAQTDLQYDLVTTTVNAADYGIPQHRHRVFLVGFRADLDVDWKFPTQTHSGAALALAQHSGH
ncbi:DNA cytosine methyltransferase [Corynebacterium cystitidis]|nr:DNA cytosine methyltransferase [Corynebacterium cystitidis]